MSCRPLKAAKFKFSEKPPDMIGGFFIEPRLARADNGKQFIKQLAQGAIPDIVFLDITMPEMDGFETAAWLKTHYSEVKILAISTYDNEKTIDRMLDLVALVFVLKDVEPVEIKTALLGLCR